MNRINPLIFVAFGASMLACYAILERIYLIDISFSRYALCVIVMIIGIYLNSNKKR